MTSTQTHSPHHMRSLTEQPETEEQEQQQQNEANTQSDEQQQLDEDNDDEDEYASPSLSELQSLFALFDTETTGHMLTADLGTALRALRLPLTEQRLVHIINTECGQMTSELAVREQAPSMGGSTVASSRPSTRPTKEQQQQQQQQSHDIEESKEQQQLDHSQDDLEDKQQQQSDDESQQQQPQPPPAQSRLDFATFHRIARQLQQHYSSAPKYTFESLLKDFQVFDTYRDGLLSIADVTTLLRLLGEPLTHDDTVLLLNEVHLDGDGKMDIRKFIQHMFETSMQTGLPDVEQEEQPHSSDLREQLQQQPMIEQE